MQPKNSSGFLLFVGIIIGLVLMIGSQFLTTVPFGSKVILLVIGAIITVLFTLVAIVSKLYVRPSADEAYVRTGMGGRKLIVDGGALYIPGIHQMKRVQLNVIELGVERTGSDALLTQDNLRADVSASFYVKVMKAEEDILQAAATLPEVTRGSVGEIERLIQNKLVAALRAAAANRSLADLNTKRKEFAEEVQASLAEDLQANGLTLESVNILRLDQAPHDTLNPDTNVFDAQGATTAARLVAEQKLQRTQIETSTEQLIAEQRTQSAKILAERELEKKSAEANALTRQRTALAESERAAQEAETKARTSQEIATAESAREAQVARTEQERQTKVAFAQAQQEIEVAELSRQQAVQIANENRERAMTEASIARETAVQLATRQQQISVAEAEKKRADAETLQLAAQKDRQAAEQAVQTTVAVAEANRKRETEVIAQEAIVRRQTLEQQGKADVQSYTVIKEAESKEIAARADATALLVRAEAEQKAATLHANAERMVKMIPVEISERQVEVAAKQVEVTNAELEAKARNLSLTRDLEIVLANITANKEIGVAQAQALGALAAKANLTIWGDPDTFRKVSGAFGNGQVAGSFFDGVMANIPEEVKKLAQNFLPSSGTSAVTEAKVPADTTASTIVLSDAPLTINNGAKEPSESRV